MFNLTFYLYDLTMEKKEILSLKFERDSKAFREDETGRRATIKLR